MSLLTYHLDKPELNNLSEKRKSELVAFWLGHQSSDLIMRANSPIYLFYDKARFLAQNNRNFNPSEYWFMVKLERRVNAKKTPIRAVSGEFFTWKQLDNFSEKLHQVDMQMGGQIVTDLFGLSAGYKRRFVTKGIMEEAIASSQLEGAHTSRKVAQGLLKGKRKPRNSSEQMIVNNYLANQRLVNEYARQEMSWELMSELQSQLTRDVLDPKDQGKMRSDQDKIVVQGQIGTQVYITHQAPGESFLKKEIERLIDFANDLEVENSQHYVHPVVKAIMLHFWIGYLHPFADGNGRLARNVFYWYLLKHNYWLMEYLSVSRAILDAPNKYAFAYIYTEQDDLDLNYFVDFNLGKIMEAFHKFEQYLSRKFNEKQLSLEMWADKEGLSERQKSVLAYLGGGEDNVITNKTYREFYEISLPTAAKELKELVAIGLVQARKEGRNVFYSKKEENR